MTIEAPPEQLQSSVSSILPAVSLIICSRNRPEMLADTVTSILEGDNVPAEIVIIDQSDAPDPTLPVQEMSRNSKIRYVWTQSVGSSRGRNEGVAAAHSDILAFTDDDMRVASAWFSELIGALVANGSRSVVTGQVLPEVEGRPGGFVPSIKIDQVPTMYKGRIGRDVLYTGNFALYRSALKVVGGFDERLGPGTAFPSAEDNELAFRLLEAGYRIHYVPQAVLYHRAWRSERDYLSLRWNYGRGQGAFYAKYFSVRDRYMLRRMIGSINDHVMQAVWQARRDRRRAFGNIVYVAGLLSGAIQWILTQRRTH